MLYQKIILTDIFFYKIIWIFIALDLIFVFLISVIFYFMNKSTWVQKKSTIVHKRSAWIHKKSTKNSLSISAKQRPKIFHMSPQNVLFVYISTRKNCHFGSNLQEEHIALQKISQEFTITRIESTKSPHGSTK